MTFEEAWKFEAAQHGIDITASDWRATFATLVVDRMGASFEDESNPILPWQALRVAIDGAIDIPEWVLMYFHGRAKHLNDLLARGDRRGRREAEAVGKILGFGAMGKGGTSVARQTLNGDRNVIMAVHVVAETAICGSRTTAFGTVAERFAVSEDTVERAFHTHRQKAESRINNLLKSSPHQ
ncbi:hypothetical protein EN875_033975 [Mesorhizobium sp. M2D.F.Ca.ET.232.01.1.1]|uniref:hypothetical protein n=1 Tax=Mesorhizobium sp. M2D.F.Ca.ET.232.01.1.1 TaxID=2496670 RepID=UPI000FCC4570|nr:hypothetical protein [Mesorhizobium sp. M2D.F.Ca.ET.232.01.1.1]TGP27351.1 hypothetical protein EN875_033975 [Mesorhizobium sp. M2D.F.Ca.ET.232.01.1.1]